MSQLPTALDKLGYVCACVVVCGGLAYLAAKMFFVPALNANVFIAGLVIGLVVGLVSKDG